MAIYQTGAYQVKATGVEKVKAAIRDFVDYIHANEPGSQMYLAWQNKEDPTRFIHLFIFQDAESARRHGESEAVKRFEAAYTPELVGGNVVFTDYEMIAGKLSSALNAHAIAASTSSRISPPTSPKDA